MTNLTHITQFRLHNSWSAATTEGTCIPLGEAITRSFFQCHHIICPILYQPCHSSASSSCLPSHLLRECSSPLATHAAAFSVWWRTGSPLKGRCLECKSSPYRDMWWWGSPAIPLAIVQYRQHFNEGKLRIAKNGGPVGPSKPQNKRNSTPLLLLYQSFLFPGCTNSLPQRFHLTAPHYSHSLRGHCEVCAAVAA